MSIEKKYIEKDLNRSFQWSTDGCCCASLFVDIYNDRTGKSAKKIIDYLNLPYTVAMKKFMLEYGSIKIGYLEILKPYTHDFRPENMDEIPDIIIVDAEGIDGEVFGDISVCFVDENRNLYTHFDSGIRPVRVDPKHYIKMFIIP